MIYKIIIIGIQYFCPPTNTYKMCIRDRHTDLCKAQPVKRIEQEPAALGLGTGVQNSHQLMQRFHAAKVFLRRFAVDPYTLGGNEVLVKLPAIPMPPLFMEQVLRFMIGPVKKFIDF